MQNICPSFILTYILKFPISIIRLNIYIQMYVHSTSVNRAKYKIKNKGKQNPGISLRDLMMEMLHHYILISIVKITCSIIKF